MKKVMIVFMSLVLCFAICACSQNENNVTPTENIAADTYTEQVNSEESLRHGGNILINASNQNATTGTTAMEYKGSDDTTFTTGTTGEVPDGVEINYSPEASLLSVTVPAGCKDAQFGVVVKTSTEIASCVIVTVQNNN